MMKNKRWSYYYYYYTKQEKKKLRKQLMQIKNEFKDITWWNTFWRQVPIFLFLLLSLLFNKVYSLLLLFMYYAITELIMYVLYS